MTTQTLGSHTVLSFQVLTNSWFSCCDQHNSAKSVGCSMYSWWSKNSLATIYFVFMQATCHFFCVRVCVFEKPCWLDIVLWDGYFSVPFKSFVLLNMVIVPIWITMKLPKPFHIPHELETQLFLICDHHQPQTKQHYYKYLANNIGFQQSQ